MPTVSEVVALISRDIHPEMTTHDIILEKKRKLKQISEIPPSYLALQYPLIFSYGEDEFHLGIEKGFRGVGKKKRN